MCRSETLSEANRVEPGVHQKGDKRTRTELRTLRERRKPGYYNDYVLNMALTSLQVLDQTGKPIRASDITLPRSHHEMLSPRWKECFLSAELEEMNALTYKGVIAEIESTKIPKTAI